MKQKQQPGKDMVLYGSGTLGFGIYSYGLIVEYRLIVNPVVLGSGKPLFKGLKDKLNFQTLKATTLGSGNVLLATSLRRRNKTGE